MRKNLLRLLILLLLTVSIACKPENVVLTSNPTDEETKAVDNQVEPARWQEASIELLEPNGYQAQFTNDSKAIIYTSKTLDSLWKYDLATKEAKLLSDKRGAGNLPVIKDGQLIYQVKGRKKHLEKVNINTFEVTQIDKAKSGLSPQELKNQEDKTTYAKPSEDLNSILIVEGDQQNEIAPQGEKNYINAAISPDQKNILYKVAGLGVFISDLAGETKMELGDINSPSWIDETHILFSKSENDGHLTTKSDIYIQNIQTKERIHLTSKIDKVLEFPRINNQGSMIVTNTPKGEIYMIQI